MLAQLHREYYSKSLHTSEAEKHAPCLVLFPNKENVQFLTDGFHNLGLSCLLFLGKVVP